MKISLDGGALCQKKITGNRVYSLNLIKALAKYDKKNQYYVYLFDNLNQKKIVKANNIFFKKIKPKIGWSKFGLSLAEFFDKKDVFLAINQALPLFTTAKVIGISHGLSFYFYPKFYPQSAKKMFNEHQQMLKKAKFVLVSSIKIKKEMEKVFGKSEKIKVLPFGIPFDILSQIKKMKKTKRKKFFLVVGLNQPIKNFSFIREAFLEFKKEFSDFQLKIVHNIDRKKLIKLYQEAAGLLTASYYESFNFPVLEAIALNCSVVAMTSAVIPEMQPFVNLAKTKDEFIKKIKAVVNNQGVFIDRSLLLRKFSWQTYVETLEKLYEKT